MWHGWNLKPRHVTLHAIGIPWWRYIRCGGWKGKTLGIVGWARSLDDGPAGRDRGCHERTRGGGVFSGGQSVLHGPSLFISNPDTIFEPAGRLANTYLLLDTQICIFLSYIIGYVSLLDTPISIFFSYVYGYKLYENHHVTANVYMLDIL